jgi:hypothetical protein
MSTRQNILGLIFLVFVLAVAVFVLKRLQSPTGPAGGGVALWHPDASRRVTAPLAAKPSAAVPAPLPNGKEQESTPGSGALAGSESGGKPVPAGSSAAPAPAAPAPAATDPRSIDPRSTDPHSTGPRSTDPRSVDPRSVDPRSTDLRSTGPSSVDPRSVEPRGAGPRGEGRRTSRRTAFSSTLSSTRVWGWSPIVDSRDRHQPQARWELYVPRVSVAGGYPCAHEPA